MQKISVIVSDGSNRRFRNETCHSALLSTHKSHTHKPGIGLSPPPRECND